MLDDARSAPPRLDGRRLRGDRTRRLVLDHSVAIAATDGLEGLTFGKVANVACVPKSTLQVLFKDRQALQLQTLDAAAESFAVGIRGKLTATAGPLEHLRQLCNAWFDLISETGLPGGCLVTAAAMEFRARHGAIADAIIDHRVRWRDQLRMAARAAQDAGELDQNIDLEQLVFEILALQGAANASLGEGSSADFDRARRGLETLLTRASRRGSV